MPVTFLLFRMMISPIPSPISLDILLKGRSLLIGNCTINKSILQSMSFLRFHVSWRKLLRKIGRIMLQYPINSMLTMPLLKILPLWRPLLVRKYSLLYSGINWGRFEPSRILKEVRALVYCTRSIWKPRSLRLFELGLETVVIVSTIKLDQNSFINHQKIP